MIVAVHQPHYFPWQGYFDKIDSADVFVLLDTVQYEKNGWQNRNRIAKPNGGWMWLTVPVRHEFGRSIAETRIADEHHWERKHAHSLQASYASTPFYERYTSFLADIYSRRWEYLADLNRVLLDFFLAELGIETEIVAASDMGGLPDEPNARLAALVSRLGGTTYLAGGGSAGYFDPAPFERENIGVSVQDFEPAPYEQHQDTFIPGLSVIDVLCMCGDRALSVIRNGRRTEL